MQIREKGVTVVTPTGCIGNRGIHRETLERVFEERHVDCLAVDAGSLDPGPWYLGSGEEHSPEHFIRWDLEAILSTCVPRKVPIIIGSAGGNGARSHVDKTVALVREIAAEHGLSFRLAVIYCDVERGFLLERLAEGAVTPVGHDRMLSVEDVEATTTMVGMMGVTPIVEALDAGADVVVAGRAADNAVIAAFPIRAGCDPALALHMGDILECGESAAVELRPFLRGLQQNRIPMIGEIFDDHFLLTAGHEDMAVTPQSALAHSFYERSSIYLSKQPNGTLDKTASIYRAVDGRTTSVSGTRLTAVEPTSMLIEGVKPVGFRSISIVGVRNPTMIGQLDVLVDGIVRANIEHYGKYGKIEIHVHQYGRNAVLKEHEWQTRVPHEIGLVVDVVAATQELAHEACLDTRMRLCWSRYDGRQTTAGNAAVLFSPAVIDAGMVYGFSVHHAVALKADDRPFSTRLEQI